MSQDESQKNGSWYEKTQRAGSWHKIWWIIIDTHSKSQHQNRTPQYSQG